MNKFYKKCIIIIMMVCIVLNMNLSFAVTKNEIDKQKKEQTQITNQIDDVKEKQEEVSNKKTEIETQVKNLNAQIDAYENEIDELENKIDELEEKIKQSEKQIKEDEEKYEKKENDMKNRLVAMYEYGELSYLEVIFSADSFVDLLSSYYLISEVSEYDTDMLKQIEEDKKKIENEKAELEKNKSTLNSSKKSKQAKANALVITKKEKNEYISELSEEQANLEKELSELKSHESSISSKIKAMQAAYEKEQEEARKKAEEEARKRAQEEAKKKAASNTTQKTTSTSSGTTSNKSSSSRGFGWPVANPVIGTNYGVSGPYWSSGRHTGVDFRASDYTPVYSIGDGQVFDTGYNSAYGNYVEIYHGNNIFSFYAHASKVQVSVGQKVTKGQQIMLSGHSGNVTGPHLHFEIRTPGYKYANCVNPMPYLP